MSAIDSIEGARINTEGAKTVNPSTGEQIVFPPKPGDVEVLFTSGGFFGFGKRSGWESCIWFSSGRASFKASDTIESPSNPVHAIASKAAKVLAAKIVGDEGEIYSW
ncbi:hypothetical protein [Zobellella sp. DQSA1]|uniref:hypothetical protein n=1 Tax=Zobellella sp. DQSA1 TaxID=3342386 RepID=UPI0035BFDDFB